MLKFLQQMLYKRTFQVSLNGKVSSSKTMETGLCQGSVLSVTLFLMAINTITSHIPSNVQCLIYADDVILIATGEDAENTKNKLQVALNQLELWKTQTGFRISAEKSATVIFRSPRKKKPPNQGRLVMNGITVPRKNSYKCLGVTLDQHLKYRIHAEEVKAACQQRVLFIRSIAARTWGGDRSTLLNLYSATVLEKLLYSAPILSALDSKVLQSLETVHNAGLRAIIGAFRTSPIESLHAETGIPSLKMFIDQRIVLYPARRLAVPHMEPHIGAVSTVTDGNITDNSLSSNSSSLSDDADSSDERWGERPMTEPNSFRNRGQSTMNELEIQLPRTTVFKIAVCPPWQRIRPRIDKSLHSKLSQGATPSELRNLFNELRHKNYRIHRAIYTDGSKQNSKCGYGIVSQGFVTHRRLNNICIIFTAESEAIKEALSWVVEQQVPQAYLICTDSMSAVTNLEKCKIKSKWKDCVQMLLNQIADLGAEVVFCWIPSHIGIPGNEKADTEAKKALELPEDTEQSVDFSEVRKIIKLQITKRWQLQWHTNLNNKLREVKNTLLPFKAAFLGNRRDDVILARLRIGHTQLTHGYLLDKIDRPLCSRCNEPMTVKHIIVNCDQLDEHRTNHGIPGNLREALADDTEMAQKVIEYLKTINLYEKI
ncbi:uncharacterized protein LOC129752967 [Uranotaenia lowii]|uniref:uncharacterized protein LOC129752967 n=1 Tax=Uranotaenia lowii TaxID=190385 RepID=UPI002478FC06|nr:uncharacterized protein LOC129752967 [Uranotaenia lowii]